MPGSFTDSNLFFFIDPIVGEETSMVFLPRLPNLPKSSTRSMGPGATIRGSTVLHEDSVATVFKGYNMIDITQPFSGNSM